VGDEGQRRNRAVTTAGKCGYPSCIGPTEEWRPGSKPLIPPPGKDRAVAKRPGDQREGGERPHVHSSAAVSVRSPDPGKRSATPKKIGPDYRSVDLWTGNN